MLISSVAGLSEGTLGCRRYKVHVCVACDWRARPLESLWCLWSGQVWQGFGMGRKQTLSLCCPVSSCGLVQCHSIVIKLCPEPHPVLWHLPVLVSFNHNCGFVVCSISKQAYGNNFQLCASITPRPVLFCVLFLGIHLCHSVCLE